MWCLRTVSSADRPPWGPADPAGKSARVQPGSSSRYIRAARCTEAVPDNPSIVTRDEMLREFTDSWPGFVLSYLSGYGFDSQPRRAQDFAVGTSFHRSCFLLNLWHMSATSLLACAF
jgi:hypothetical protein